MDQNSLSSPASPADSPDPMQPESAASYDIQLPKRRTQMALQSLIENDGFTADEAVALLAKELGVPPTAVSPHLPESDRQARRKPAKKRAAQQPTRRLKRDLVAEKVKPLADGTRSKRAVLQQVADEMGKSYNAVRVQWYQFCLAASDEKLAEFRFLKPSKATKAGEPDKVATAQAEPAPKPPNPPKGKLGANRMRRKAVESFRRREEPKTKATSPAFGPSATKEPGFRERLTRAVEALVEEKGFTYTRAIRAMAAYLGRLTGAPFDVGMLRAYLLKPSAAADPSPASTATRHSEARRGLMLKHQAHCIEAVLAGQDLADLAATLGLQPVMVTRLLADLAVPIRLTMGKRGMDMSALAADVADVLPEVDERLLNEALAYKPRRGNFPKRGAD